MKAQRLMFTGAALVLLAALTLRANVTNITSGGPEYTNFHSALAAANSGDTLRGRAATWNEVATVPVNLHVTLDGGYNAAYTTKIGMSVLANQNANPVFKLMSGSKTYLQSLVIKGGNGTGTGAGGVWAILSTAIVVNCVVSNCASKYGAGLNSAGLIIASNTLVTECYAGQQGGGIYVNPTGFVYLSTCTVVSNYANTSGGGLYAGSGAVVRVMDTIIVTNRAKSGGGLYASEADVELRDSFVIDNYVGSGGSGGGIYQDHGTLVVSNTAINGNSSPDGGGIYNYDAVLRLYDSQVGTLASPNSTYAVNSVGGVVVDNTNADVRMCNVIIEGNMGGSSYPSIGGLNLTSTQPVWLSNVIVRFNSGRGVGGAVFTACGGLQAYYLQVVSNTADDIGGVFIKACSNLLLYAPLIVSNMSPNSTAGLNVQLEGATGTVIRAVVQYNTSSRAITFAGHGGELLYLDDLVVADNMDGLLLSGVKTHLRALTHPVQIVRNLGDSFGGVSVNGGTLYGEALNAAHPILIAHNSADPASGVGGVSLQASSYGLTAQFAGAVHVISNSGYHGGIVVTSFSNSIQALFVTWPTNGLGARIAHNHSEGPGGGLYVEGVGAKAQLHSARLEHNLAGNSFPGGGAAVVDEGEARFINTYIGDNFSSNVAGGVAVIGSSARAHFDADFSSAPSSYLPPTRLLNNVAILSGGGLYAYDFAAVYVYNTLIASNRASNATGGGLSVNNAIADVRNAVIAHNHAAGQGEGVAVTNSLLFSLVNSTVAHNGTNGLRIVNTPMSFITNTIVWGHGGVGYEFNETGFTSIVRNCTVQGGYPGTDVSQGDPLFADAAELKYELILNSPCINSGIVTSVATDCIGVLRPHFGYYDIGAYEYTAEPASILALAAGALLLARKRS